LLENVCCVYKTEFIIINSRIDRGKCGTIRVNEKDKEEALTKPSKIINIE